MSTKIEKIKQLITEAGFTDAAKEQIAKSFTLAKNSPLFVPSYAKHFNWQEFEDLVMPFYEEAFTEEEIDTFLEFYSSDLGKKILNFNDGESNGMMKVLDKWVGDKYNAVMEDMTKKQLDSYAEEKGINLDRRKSKESMLAALIRRLKK